LKAEFHEDFESEHQDELDGKHVSFDYDEIDRRLQGVREELGEAFPAAATGATEILRWCAVNEAGEVFAERIAYRRLMAILWCLSPAIFKGSPSLTELARRLGLANKATLSIHTAEVRRRFGIHNRAQAHGHNFKATTKGNP